MHYLGGGEVRLLDLNGVPGSGSGSGSGSERCGAGKRMCVWMSVVQFLSLSLCREESALAKPNNTNHNIHPGRTHTRNTNTIKREREGELTYPDALTKLLNARTLSRARVVSLRCADGTEDAKGYALLDCRSTILVYGAELCGCG
jgi:hypothetical protein